MPETTLNRLPPDHKPATQIEAVAWHLRWYGTLTARQAMKEYGIMRLAAIIHNLRHTHGFVINTIDETATNRFGKPVRFAKYKIGRHDKKHIHRNAFQNTYVDEAAAAGPLMSDEQIELIQEEHG